MTANGVASWKQCCAEGDKGHEEIRLQMSARKPNGEPTIIKPAQSRVSLLNVQSEANDPATGKKVAQSLRIAYEAVSHRLQSLRKLVEETEEEEKTIRKAYREHLDRGEIVDLNHEGFYMFGMALSSTQKEQGPEAGREYKLCSARSLLYQSHIS